MGDSASEIDLESDTSSVEGQSTRQSSENCNEMQRHMELLQCENRVLKSEIETLKLKVRSLTEANQQLRKNSVNIQAKAEQEEEYISNMLQRRISELKKEKESLALNYEQEEECLTNELSRKLVQLQKDKELLETTLAKEQETQVNKLKHRIEKLENEKISKQQSLDKLRREKIELENALEQEQEALVNRLWKKMEKLETEKRILQEKLESASAPLSATPSMQNLAGATTATCHSSSICLGGISDPNSIGISRSFSNAPHSLRGSLLLNTSPNLTSSEFCPPISQSSRDNLAAFTSGDFVNTTLPNLKSLSPNKLDADIDEDDAAGMKTPPLHPSSLSQRSLHSPMDFDNLGTTIDYEGSLKAPPTRTYRGSQSISLAAFTHPQVISSVQPSLPPPDLDSRKGVAYVASLREEVKRLRALVSSNQSEHRTRMGMFEREERIAAEENMRLKRLLNNEVERKEAFSRQFSGSESSLEMEDERQFNEASRGISNTSRFRTNSDSCPSPYHTGPYIGSCAASGSLYGPGCAFASVVAAASNSRSVSPHYCRECGQVMACSSSQSKQGQGGAPSVIFSPRVIGSGSHQIISSPPFPSTPQAPTSPSPGLTPNGRFVKPTNRAPTFPNSGSLRIGEKCDQSSKNASGDEEEDRCVTPPISNHNTSSP